MLSLLLRTWSSVCVATAVQVAAAETVVGVAGRKVALPCRLEAVKQKGADVCWGRGQPSLFTCHNAVIYAAGDQVSYRKSYRYSVSSSSLHIFKSRLSDAGFYHCRVQLPGPFNDQTSILHLIIVTPRSLVPDSSPEPSSSAQEAGSPNTPHSTASYTQTGSDVNTTGPVAAQAQSPFLQQQLNSLELFIGSTVRLSFIIFIPALLLTVAYRVWRSERRLVTDRRPTQSEELEDGNSSL